MNAPIKDKPAGTATDPAATAQAVAAAVSRVPGVAGLVGFRSGPSTYGLAGRVPGVASHTDRIEIYLRANALPLSPIAAEASRAATRVLRAGGDLRKVAVFVEELDDTVRALPSKGAADARR